MNVSLSARLGITTRVAWGLVLGVILFGPAAAVAKQPTPIAQMDTVIATGGGGDYSNISINAQSGPSGDHPIGTASFTVRLPGPRGFALVDLGGPVTCLTVTGNAAVLNIDEQMREVGIVTIRLTDNGGNGLDQFNGAATGRAATDCSPFNGGLAATLTNGRATVVDAPRLPTSKEQCKNGDWAEFGVASQGQCIKLVNQPPSGR